MFLWNTQYKYNWGNTGWAAVKKGGKVVEKILFDIVKGKAQNDKTLILVSLFCFPFFFICFLGNTFVKVDICDSKLLVLTFLRVRGGWGGFLNLLHDF